MNVTHQQYFCPLLQMTGTHFLDLSDQTKVKFKTNIVFKTKCFYKMLKNA